MNRHTLLIPLLALLAFFLGWRTWQAWTSPAGEAMSATAAGAGGSLPSAVSGDVPPPGDLSAAVSLIAVRPVFRPDRKPYQESANAIPQRNYDQELGRYTVLGVLVLSGAEKAIVTGKTGGRTDRFEVGPGDTIPGFTVVAVQPEGVFLEADGREFLLPLYAGSPKGQGPVRTEVASPAAAAPVPGTASPPSPTAAIPAPGPKPRPAAAAPVSPPTWRGVRGYQRPSLVVAPTAPPEGGPAASSFTEPERKDRPAYVPGRR